MLSLPYYNSTRGLIQKGVNLGTGKNEGYWLFFIPPSNTDEMLILDDEPRG
jgi:hypothetical protein